jgi:hypothetical protein
MRSGTPDLEMRRSRKQTLMSMVGTEKQSAERAENIEPVGHQCEISTDARAGALFFLDLEFCTREDPANYVLLPDERFPD